MKRTSTNNQGPQKPTWRKITQGGLYLQGKRNYKIKHKEEIQATPEELGRFVNQFELIKPGTGEFEIDPADFKGPEPTVLVPVKGAKRTAPAEEKEIYIIKHVGGGYHDVLSPTGKKMNEKSLKMDKALDFKQALEGETSGDE